MAPRTSGPFERIGFPGEFPFTRGVYGSMYRSRLWTMRQFAGFGTAEETNERFRYLLGHGQTGLSTAFDMPSLMGHDSDHARSEGEVGREGVALDTLDDMETLFSGIDMGDVSTSMTINAPAAVMLAFYVVAAEGQGVPAERLAGTIQTDILKEYIAQKEWCFPVDPAMRLVTDMVEFCTERMPRWHPISISGYHIREAGSTAGQELAFTLKDGFTYVEAGVERGLDVDDFAPQVVVLLQRAYRFLRGDREVPGGAADLGARAERHLRRPGRALAADALSHPDRRGQSDGPAAAQQHRQDCDRGFVGGARRHPVAAHQLVRRGARAADRAGRAGGAAHPADHRARDRGDEHDRPLGRLLFRRGAHRSPRGRGLRLFREDRRARRDGRRRQAELPAARDRRRQLPPPGGDRARRADHRRRKPARRPRRAPDASCTRCRPASRKSRSGASRPSGHAATPKPPRPRSRELRDAAGAADAT